jgi:predicted Zn-ribbon and HTH transcriptional regulator
LHLAISFSEEVTEERRVLFLRFAENELLRNGIRFLSHPAIMCKCGFVIPEDVVVRRCAEDYSDVGCPRCDRRIEIEKELLSAARRTRKKMLTREILSYV